jgi:UDP-N-acetylmuramate: L-alanyl-gamma-D-glutamyl-meso-diaminopimelate ligase
LTRKALEHVHLLGIGGTGMSALAGLLQESGCRVSGSDRPLYPPTSTLLATLGVDVYRGYDPANLEPAPDLVVVGNAISRGNPEIEEVLDRRLPYASMPQVLAERFLSPRHPLVVAGTHGKTTTTSMLAHILHAAGRDPGFLIGGSPVDLPANYRVGRGAEFVIEGDEYDTAFFDKGPKFMHYRPGTVLLGAIEYDHADIYADLEAVRTAFRRLVNLVPRRGLLVFNEDDPIARELAGAAPSRVAGYGLERGNWRADAIVETEAGTRFDLRSEEAGATTIQLAVSGRHNVLNALAAAAAAADRGLALSEIRGGLESFHGVRRRLERKGDVGGVLVLDDFAHHPTAIAATLGAVRSRHPGRRVWAVVEPRSWSMRKNVFQAPLAEALATADRVLIAKVFGEAAIADDDRLDPHRLVSDVARGGGVADYVESVDEIVKRLVAESRSGDVITIMSNGGFDGLPERLVAALEGRTGHRLRVGNT